MDGNKAGLMLLNDVLWQKDTIINLFQNKTRLFYSVLKRRLPPRDCYDLLMDGNNVSGVYDVYLPKARKILRVFCDMESNDGGWMVRTP